MADDTSPATPDAATFDRKAFRMHDRALLLGFYRWLFWDALVARLPRSLAPNTITVTGETCAVLAAACSYFASRGHAWLYLVAAGLLVVYMTGDNIDGPHARRTQQTSTLGEFLDHGLDGLASVAVLLASAFPLGLGGTWLAAVASLAGLGFFCTFWAQFRTYTLVTPQISAMEGVTGCALFLVLVFVLGQPAWLQFASDHVTPATVVVALLALGYVIAVASPLARAAREKVSLVEVVPVALAIAAIAAASARAGGMLPTVAMSLVIAELVCRQIIHRQKDDLRGVLRPAHAILVAPWLAVWVAPAAAIEPLAYGALALAAISYVVTFYAGYRLLRR